MISWWLNWHRQLLHTMWNPLIGFLRVTFWQRVPFGSNCFKLDHLSQAVRKLNSSWVRLIELINWANYPGASTLLTYGRWQLTSEWWTRRYKELVHEFQATSYIINVGCVAATLTPLQWCSDDSSSFTNFLSRSSSESQSERGVKKKLSSNFNIFLLYTYRIKCSTWHA